jgi:eukaryotic-like serine/threonine-protein kinase
MQAGIQRIPLQDDHRTGGTMGQDDTTFAFPGNNASSSSSSDRDDLRPGAAAGDYIIGDLIAEGGCGSVYYAKHRILPRRVALKVLHANLASQPKMVERFLREVELVRRLRHPNIIEIEEIGVFPSGRPFFAMEYIEGRTLGALLRDEGRLSPVEALDVLEPVCAALAAAHASGIIHRDVKASNILVSYTEPRSIKLLDFGIAKLATPDADFRSLTSVGRSIGTPSIMAPEQLLGEPIDARVDVYALGILLYRLLTGRLPFDARSLGELVRQHIEEPAPRPSHRTPIAPALDAIVLRCLEKDPERRFDSVTSFIESLQKALDRSAEGSWSGPLVRAMGVAIYLELRMRTDDEEFNDEISHDLGCVLDLTEERLKREGFLLATVTDDQILGVCSLPDDPAALPRAREEALRVAMSLHEELIRRPTADDRVHVRISVHVDEILVRPSDKPEIVGGALLRIAAWAPLNDAYSLGATPEVIQGLPGFEVTTGSGPLVTIASRPVG